MRVEHPVPRETIAERHRNRGGAARLPYGGPPPAVQFDSRLPFFDLPEPQAHNSLHAFNRGLCRVQLPICQSYPRLFR